MPLYRTLTPLRFPKTIVPAGKVITLKGDQSILERVGAIAPILTPPLAILPGWAERAACLESAGILTGEQFVEADAALLAAKLDMSPDMIQTLKGQLMTLWSSSPPEDDCHCG